MHGIWDLNRNAVEVVTGATHERVLEAAEIGAVSHFLGEDVGDVVFSADVRNQDSAIGNPFSCGVLLVFDVVITLGGHVMAPLDASIIAIVERGGGLTVVDGVAEVGEAGDHVSCVDSELGTHVGSPNLRIA